MAKKKVLILGYYRKSENSFDAVATVVYPYKDYREFHEAVGTVHSIITTNRSIANISDLTIENAAIIALDDSALSVPIYNENTEDTMDVPVIWNEITILNGDWAINYDDDEEECIIR